MLVTLTTKLILISLHEEMDTLQINLANLKSVDKQENPNKSSELADSDSFKVVCSVSLTSAGNN